jgi:hypothetical protein
LAPHWRQSILGADGAAVDFPDDPLLFADGAVDVVDVDDEVAVALWPLSEHAAIESASVAAATIRRAGRVHRGRSTWGS